MSISVIVSSYNNASYLALFLESMAWQQCRPDEVIITDDGSSESEWVRIREMAAASSLAVTAVTQPDLGFRLAAARNAGVRAASGDWLVFFDADMAVGPDVLAVHARAARPQRFLMGNRGNLPESVTRERLEAGTLGDDFERLWYASARRHLYRSYPKYLRHVVARRLGCAARHKPQITGCHFSLSRADLEAINGFDEGYEGWGYEDDDLSMRLYMSGCSSYQLMWQARAVHLWHPGADRAGGVRANLANRGYFYRRDVAAVCSRGIIQPKN